MTPARPVGAHLVAVTVPEPGGAQHRGREPLTARQQQVLDGLVEHVRQHGYPPSVRELAAIVGGALTSVDYQLGQLAAKGHIERARGVARGIRVRHLQAVNTDG